MQVGKDFDPSVLLGLGKFSILFNSYKCLEARKIEPCLHGWVVKLERALLSDDIRTRWGSDLSHLRALGCVWRWDKENGFFVITSTLD